MCLTYETALTEAWLTEHEIVTNYTSHGDNINTILYSINHNPEKEYDIQKFLFGCTCRRCRKILQSTDADSRESRKTKGSKSAFTGTLVTT